MLYRSLPPLLAIAAFAMNPAGAADDWALETFCEEVQRVTAQTDVDVTLMTYTRTSDYRHSKPGIDPVTIHQYVTRDARGRPRMVSCKVKSVDHLRAVYGDSAAGTQGSCEQVTRSIVAQASARAGGQAKLAVVPEEQVWTGSSYLGPFELLSVDDSGAIDVHTRYMRVDWDDWRWYVMPNRLRGHLYCHVIAPDYADRLLAGEKPDLSPIDIPLSPEDR